MPFRSFQASTPTCSTSCTRLLVVAAVGTGEAEMGELVDCALTAPGRNMKANRSIDMMAVAPFVVFGVLGVLVPPNRPAIAPGSPLFLQPTKRRPRVANKPISPKTGTTYFW